MLHCLAVVMGVMCVLVLAEVALLSILSQVVTHTRPLVQNINDARQAPRHACDPPRQHWRGGPKDLPPQHATASLQRRPRLARGRRRPQPAAPSTPTLPYPCHCSAPAAPLATTLERTRRLCPAGSPAAPSPPSWPCAPSCARARGPSPPRSKAGSLGRPRPSPSPPPARACARSAGGSARLWRRSLRAGGSLSLLSLLSLESEESLPLESLLSLPLLSLEPELLLESSEELSSDEDESARAGSGCQRAGQTDFTRAWQWQSAPELEC
jgi:hypothetical protein